MPRWMFWVTAVLLVGLALVLLVDAPFCFEHVAFHRHRGGAERPASSCLKTLSSAQADFRANDRDGDGKENFWRADIAGLYALAPGGGPAIKLIELSVASADERPKTDLSQYSVPSAKAGYWFRAIRHADEDPKAPDPNRFAYVAFPDNPSAGKYLFIIDENNTVFRAVADGRRGIDVFPTDAELQQSWSKLD